MIAFQVLLTGYKGHYPPTDEQGFLDFARQLPSPTIHNALKQAKPISKILSYTKTGNVRHQFEKAPPPDGLCVIGDAACYFNPVNVRILTAS